MLASTSSSAIRWFRTAAAGAFTACVLTSCGGSADPQLPVAREPTTSSRGMPMTTASELLRELKGMQWQEAQKLAEDAGYHVVTFAPDDPKSVSAELDLQRLSLVYDKDGIVIEAWTG